MNIFTKVGNGIKRIANDPVVRDAAKMVVVYATAYVVLAGAIVGINYAAGEITERLMPGTTVDETVVDSVPEIEVVS
jgi:hypothetical protein